MRKPYWRKRLELDMQQAGLTEPELMAVVEKYEKAGLSLRRVPRKGWRVFGIPKGPQKINEATIFLRWDSLKALVSKADQLITEWKGLQCSPATT